MFKYVLILLFHLFFYSLNAQGYLAFIENKGQWNKQVKFKASLPYGTLYLLQTGYKIVLYDTTNYQQYFTPRYPKKKEEQPDPVFGEEPTVKAHAYEVSFVNSNSEPEIISEKKNSTYYNYFIGNDSAKWASHCNSYNAVTYKNVYNNIDIRFYTNQEQLKYDIIVYPGGDPSKVKLFIDGADALNIRKGELIINTSVGVVKEAYPYTYQIADAKREIVCNYRLNNKIIDFDIKEYDKSNILIIDPEIVFASFIKKNATQSITATNLGYSGAYDGDGNFILTGAISSDSFFVSKGAYQIKFNSTIFGAFNFGSHFIFHDPEIIITKLNPLGTDAICATFLGGAIGTELPNSTVVDKNGNILILGVTSSTDFPATRSTYGEGGVLDIFIAKLNNACTNLVASVRIGGKGIDGLNIRPAWQAQVAPKSPIPISIQQYNGDDARAFIEIDKTDNIYIVSCTQSNDFPISANAAQKSNRGGKYNQDAVMMKFSPDLNTLMYSTYLGGSEDDAAYSLAISPLSNDIYVVGVTGSNNFASNTVGTIMPDYKGGIGDGFISRFSNDGSNLFGSSYMGTSGMDNIYAIAFDLKGYPYITGTTTGSWPLVNANWSEKNGKQFIAKLQPDLSAFVYSTVFGTDTTLPNIVTTAFFVDRCEQVYVAGYGGTGDAGGYDNANGTLRSEYLYPNAGIVGLTVTPNAISTYSNKAGGFYYFILASNAQKQLYGSFFGTKYDPLQNGQAVRGDHSFGGTSRFNKDGILYQSYAIGHSIISSGGKVTNFPTTPNAWQSDQPNLFYIPSMAAVKIAFGFGGISGELQSNIDGVIKANACLPNAVKFTDVVAKAKLYRWDFGDGTAEQRTTIPTISHPYTSSGSYKVRLISIDSTTCNIADTSFVYIRTGIHKAINSFTANLQQPCADQTFEFNNSASLPTGAPAFTASSFMWNFGDGKTQAAGYNTVLHRYTNPGNYEVQLILQDTNYCNAPDTIRANIIVPSVIKAAFNYGASAACTPVTIGFTNNSTGANNSYRWNFGDGNSSTQMNPSYRYSTPGTYTVQLIATDNNSCNKADTTTQTITLASSAQAVYSYSPQPPQPNTPIVFNNQSMNASSYKWLYGDGDSLVSTASVVKHIYNSTGNFNACLIAYNNNAGCLPDTACQTIKAFVTPLANLPNAFSPNGDGNNDILYIRGYGIAKMQWRIYNRWGNLVYESASPTAGWDGKYKGTLQAQGVYTYSLDIVFSSGEKLSKTGDITLLR
ncbi:MAG: PKD domain-containing protein [Sphingobacteriia bacterium]|jgi:gliding motility-associated-like protein